ncbi:MAG: hypothetical protein ACFCD0_24390 [Gemmataceae bacterium]
MHPDTKTQTLYIVQKVYWWYDDDRYYPDMREGTDLCKAFRSRKNAETYRDEMLAKHWIEVGGPITETWEFDETTNLTAEQLYDRFRELGAFGEAEPQTPTGDIQPVWADDLWWSFHFAKLPPETQSAICQLFDKAQKFEIIEMEMDLPDDSEAE